MILSIYFGVRPKLGCEGGKGQVHPDAPIAGIEILIYILHHFFKRGTLFEEKGVRLGGTSFLESGLRSEPAAVCQLISRS